MKASVLRFCGSALLVLGCASALAQGAAAPGYLLIVGYPKGGPTDLAANLVRDALAEELKQPVRVENVPGDAGVVGFHMAMAAAPDGRTLYLASSPTLTVAPHLQSAFKFNPSTDLTLLSMVMDFSLVLAVPTNSPYKTVQELLGAAKRASPPMPWGSSGVGGSPHLAGEMLKSLTGLTLDHHPFSGSGGSWAGMQAGSVAFMFDVTSTALKVFKSGAARPLAVTSQSRNRLLPDVPTMVESGVPMYMKPWIAVVGPPNMQATVSKQLIDAFTTILAKKSFRDQAEALGYDLVQGGPAALKSRIDGDLSLWQSVIRAGHIPKN